MVDPQSVPVFANLTSHTCNNPRLQGFLQPRESLNILQILLPSFSFTEATFLRSDAEKVLMLVSGRNEG